MTFSGCSSKRRRSRKGNLPSEGRSLADIKYLRRGLSYSADRMGYRGLRLIVPRSWPSKIERIRGVRAIERLKESFYHRGAHSGRG